MTVFKCAWCAKHLIEPTGLRQTRSDKRFCDASCRGKYHRWKKRLQKLQLQAITAVNLIEPYLEHEAARPDAVAAMKAIRDRSIGHLAWHGVKGVS